MRFKVTPSRMESAMRMIGAACLVAMGGMLIGAPARADTVPPLRGTAPGVSTPYPLASQTDVRQLAVDHCARYDKLVKFLAVDAQYGGYISFACRWGPHCAYERAPPAPYCGRQRHQRG